VGRRRKRKHEAELIEQMRSALAGLRVEVQTALTENAAVRSLHATTELEQWTGEPRATSHGTQDVGATIGEPDNDLVNVLKRVGNTCDALAERVQIDRIERAALVDAVGRLTTALAVAGTLIPSGPSASRARERATVIGGSVGPQQPAASDALATLVELVDAEPHDEIDLEAEARTPDRSAPPVTRPLSQPPRRSGRPVRPDGVEVRCRFGDRWVTGFEVCEVIRLDDRTRYRLRRRSDGSVIPMLFEEKDLRFFSTAFVDPH
jgi:hypothetical protein